MEDEAVGENGEKRGKTFDGVYQGDGDDGCCSGGEDVAPNLEESEREGGIYDFACWSADAVFQRRYGGFD